jgi:superfamily II DNA or RNA helicase
LSWQDYCDFALPPVLSDLDGVAPGVLLFLFPDLAAKILSTCAPTAALTRFATGPAALAASDLPTPRIFLALCAWHTWTASRDGLAQLAKAAADRPLLAVAEACRRLLDGDAGAADLAFAKAMKTRYRDGGIGAADYGPFVALAAFAAIRANQSETRVRTLIRRLDNAFMDARHRGQAYFALSSLDAVANRNGAAAEGISLAFDAARSPLNTFVCALESLFRHDGIVAEDLGAESLRLLRDVHRAGYGWMAASLAPCVQRLLPGDAEALGLCRRVAEAATTKPLWGECHILQPWEQALKEIGELLPRSAAGGGGDDGTAGSHLLQWLLVLDARQPDDVRVQRVFIRLRKRLKSGNWSSGQYLDLDKLLSGSQDAFLGEKDLQVKAAIYRQMEQHQRFYYAFDRAYGLATFLIDHPQVYAVQGFSGGYIGNCGTLPIRLVRGEIAIEIGTAKGGRESVIRIPWSPKSAYEDLQIVQERNDVFTVYEKGALHQRLAGIVNRYGGNDHLVIPAEGGEALKRLLAPLAQVIGIKGEFDTEAVDARMIAGGVNLHLRARLVNGVLHLDLVNQPAPDLPLFIAPGSGMRKALSRLAGETVAVCRDLDGERAALDAFEAACPSLAAWTVTESHWEVDEIEQILAVLDEVHALADKIPLEWPEGDPIEVVRPGSGSPYVLNSAAGVDFWLEIGGDVTLDDGKVMTFTDLLAKIGGRTEGFVPLSERRYLCLTKNLARQLELLAKAGEVTKQTLRLPPAALPLLDAMASADGREGFDFPTLVRDRLAEFRKAFRHTATLPASLTCELRPYQKDGFVWLSRFAACGLGACLADDMGLGKTIQMLALLTARADDGPALVIAPTSVSRNWADEAARFAPALRVTLLAEAQDRATLVLEAQPFDVLVCSYGLLTFEEELLTGRKWGVVILDEAQAVKNRLAKRTRIVKRLDARMRTVATGTPVENSLGELWSLFDFLNPGLLGSHGRFEQRFCNSDGSVSPLLKRMTAPFILRRLKSEVLDDLPPKTEITLTVTLEDDERSLYESCRREALASLESPDDNANRIMILAHLTKLRRACCHPSLLLPGSTLPGQKVETFLELVADLRASGHRALVFSQFVDFLGIIRQRLDQAGVTYQYLDGATPLGQRSEAVSRFQRGEGDLFLISLKAGGTGLNLTAANFVILLDPWWNPAVEMQAADRAHRIGQRNPVTIYRLVTADTVEERVVELHAKKRAMAEELLEGTGNTRLSATDLVALFRT